MYEFCKLGICDSLGLNYACEVSTQTSQPPPVRATLSRSQVSSLMVMPFTGIQTRQPAMRSSAAATALLRALSCRHPASSSARVPPTLATLASTPTSLTGTHSPQAQLRPYSLDQSAGGALSRQYGHPRRPLPRRGRGNAASATDALPDATSSSATAHDGTTDVEVTRHNFEAALPVIREAVARSAFVAMDCEMSGLFTGDPGFTQFDDMSHRYQVYADSARSLTPLQLGLSCFAWTGAAYEARTFNIYLFPQRFEDFQPKFLCMADAIEFLSSVGFDFNKCFGSGVPFMPLTFRDAKLAGAKGGHRRRAVRKRAELKAPVLRIKTIVREWLETSTAPTLDLEPVTSFRRAIQRQAVEEMHGKRRGHKGFYVQEVMSDEGRQQVLRLVRASERQALEFQAAEKVRYINSVHAAAGASCLMEIIRDSGKPAVLHNPVLDVAHMLESFVAPIPAHYEDYKMMVQEWFPGGLYDTKFIAHQIPEVTQGVTSLEQLHSALCFERDTEITAWLSGCGTPAERWLPAVKHASSFDRYRAQGNDGAKYAHEAGYDAYLTGAVFAYEVFLLQAKAGVELVEPSLGHMRAFLGRLYQPNTDYPAMDLWKSEASPSRERLLCITDLEPGSGYSDIVDLCRSVGIQLFRVQVSARRSVAYLQLNSLDRQGTTRSATQDMLKTAAKAAGRPWQILTPESFREAEAGSSVSNDNPFIIIGEAGRLTEEASEVIEAPLGEDSQRGGSIEVGMERGERQSKGPKLAQRPTRRKPGGAHYADVLAAGTADE